MVSDAKIFFVSFAVVLFVYSLLKFFGIIETNYNANPMIPFFMVLFCTIIVSTIVIIIDHNMGERE